MTSGGNNFYFYFASITLYETSPFAPPHPIGWTPLDGSCFLCVSSTHYSTRPAKRLWNYLVTRDYLQDVFIRYIFRKQRSMSEVLSVFFSALLCRHVYVLPASANWWLLVYPEMWALCLTSLPTEIHGFTVVSVLYSRKRNTVLAVSLISVYWPKCNFVWLSGVVVWAWTGGWSSQTESQPLYCRVRPCTSCLCTPTSVAKQYKLVPVLSWRGVNRHWPLVYTLAVSAGAWLRVVESEISTILLASEGLYLLCFVKVTI